MASAADDASLSTLNTADVYPEIEVSLQDLQTFKMSLHSASHSHSKHQQKNTFVTFVERVAQRWTNMCRSINPDVTSMHLAFGKWYFVHHLFKRIEDQRERKKQLAMAKETLLKKKRSPKQILNLIHFHGLYMENVADIQNFKTFRSLTQRKQLQTFYKHLTMKNLEPNTPIFLQGTPISVGKYFVVLEGGVKLYRCHDERRVKSIITSLPRAMMEGPCLSHQLNNSGYLGNCECVVETKHGFGGVQLIDEQSHLWNNSAVSGPAGCELLIIEKDDYDNFLYSDHVEKFKFARRIKELRTMRIFQMMLDTQILHLGEACSTERYIRKQCLANLDTPLTKVIIIVKGEVQVIASVEDPRSESRKIVEVEIATLRNGNTIGDIELHQKRSKISLKYVAITEVEAYEITLEQWERQIWVNWHAKEIKNQIIQNVNERVAFHSKRVGEVMAKLAVEKFEREQTLRRLGENPDAMEKLTNIKHTWENEVRQQTADEYAARGRPKTSHELINKDYVCEPAVLTSDRGFVFGKKPPKKLSVYEQSEREKLDKMHFDHYSDAIPECVKIPPLPAYYDREKIGSRAGGLLKNLDKNSEEQLR